MIDCLVWDWNGTLLDDTAASLNAFNAELVRGGLKPITLDFYRENFAFPVKPFYTLCGVDVTRDWDGLARAYHEAYAREKKALNVEAKAALARVRSCGIQQGILSVLREDLLKGDVAREGIGEYFSFVCGTTTLDGESKVERAKTLRRALGAAVHVVMIGDAVHDAVVAEAMGAKCVLCAQGGHSLRRLRAVAPTGETLLKSLDLAFRLYG